MVVIYYCIRHRNLSFRFHHKKEEKIGGGGGGGSQDVFVVVDRFFI